MGAFGVVDLARDKEDTSKLVAVKTFRADKMAEIPAHSQKVTARLWEEVSIQSRCHNRHILKVIEYFVVDTKLEGFAVEYCSGGSLKDRIAVIKDSGVRLAEEMVARWMIHILRALLEIHHLKIIHRDVKLDNFLLASFDDEVLKLSDFGMACELLEGTVKARVGTPFFMAPEVVAGVGYNTKADCWSAGVTFLFLLDAHSPLFKEDQLCGDQVPNVSDIRWADRGPPIEALRLLESLLTYSVQGRWSARRAIEHPFLEKGANSPRQELSTRRKKCVRAFNPHQPPAPPERQYSRQPSGSSFGSARSTSSARRNSARRTSKRRSSSKQSGSSRGLVTVSSPAPSLSDDPWSNKKTSGSRGLPSLRGDDAIVRSEESQTVNEEEVEKDLMKIRRLIGLFDDRNCGRLNLEDCQNMFSVANPVGAATYPEKGLYKKTAKNSKAGLTAFEVYYLVNCSSDYVAKLWSKIEKWSSMPEEERMEKMTKKKRALVISNRAKAKSAMTTT